MNEILFLLFAFFTIFLSVRLSLYADKLSKSSKISGVFIGGILIASVTSLPEFVTCFSSVFVNNNELAVGDILGSNIFNIFMISFFDLVFIKNMIFTKTDKSHSLIFRLILLNYLVLFLFITGLLSFSFIPTFAIIITYSYYLINALKKKSNKVIINDYSDDHLFFKVIVTAVLMIFSSVLLTIVVNNLSIKYPSFSSSFLGAIFLGITTSLPEVVTCYTLINLNNYDLALSDIIGSNFFNLLILAIADLFVLNGSIYSFSDSNEFILILFGFLFTLLCFMSNKLKNNIFKYCYGVFSFFIVIMYLGYWIINLLC